MKQECIADAATDSFGIMIFGASGDLTKKKLLPALFNLFSNGLLPKSFFIVGAARSGLNDRDFRKSVSEVMTTRNNPLLKKFLSCIYYQQISYSDVGSFHRLMRKVQALEKKYSTAEKRIFYLAVPPAIGEEIVRSIGESGLPSCDGWKRIVLEKPFGWNLPSAENLNKTLLEYFEEEDIFRIDHYLGKETVQDILLFRFANFIFEPVWNRNHIDHVQITAAEHIGISDRGGYYDRVGIIRDMFQNHILQLLSLIAMEPPPFFEPKRIREEKVKVFRSLRPINQESLLNSTVFGQYAGGTIEGEKVPAYREEQGIVPDSLTPTFAAVKIFIDNWRWQGVPFYLRSGKRLSRRVTEVSLHFRNVPHSIFKDIVTEEAKPNVLVFRIQPDESIHLTFQTKIPATKLCFRDVTMNFSYKDYDSLPMPEAYERVLLDCLRGDHLLFVGQEGVEFAWKFFTPLLNFLENENEVAPHIHMYRSGTFGPAEAEDFILRDGRRWWVK
jgi:glucose-6-phosphate 1-dehydrogenase